MYVSGFSYPICLNLCYQRGAFWVQMCPAVHTPLMLTTYTDPPMNRQPIYYFHIHTLTSPERR